jgi:hypothetical protein
MLHFVAVPESYLRLLLVSGGRPEKYLPIFSPLPPLLRMINGLAQKPVLHVHSDILKPIHVLDTSIILTIALFKHFITF